MPMPTRLDRPPIPPFGDDRADGGEARTWLVPCGIAGWGDGMEAAGFMRLAGGRLGFSHLDVINDYAGELSVARVPAAEFRSLAAGAGPQAETRAHAMLDRITRPRRDFASLDMSVCHVMGIVNATPDSFSDGGKHHNPDAAIAAGRAMVEAGASVIDIGGESTRPGAAGVSHDEECARIVPVIKTLSDEGHIVSADTRHTEVMRVATDNGAAIINDVGGLRDEGAAELLAVRGTSAIIMHMQGEPETMQDAPVYRHAPTDIFDWLQNRIAEVSASGMEAVAVDPGFGFGKTPEHNMEIMASLALFHGLGVPVLLGASRKGSIGHLSRGEAAGDRLPGSLALASWAFAQGVQMIRAHDVAETRQALACIDGVLHRSGVAPMPIMQDNRAHE